jgi:hypothetical protein
MVDRVQHLHHYESFMASELHRSAKCLGCLQVVGEPLAGSSNSAGAGLDPSHA